jgi:mRNA interferase HigB
MLRFAIVELAFPVSLLHNANVVIRNRKAIIKAMRRHALVRKPLAEWVEIAEGAQWRNIIEARKIWATADSIKGTPFTCFNVGGNSFRLIAIISYAHQEIYVEEILTHSEYSKKYVR